MAFGHMVERGSPGRLEKLCPTLCFKYTPERSIWGPPRKNQCGTTEVLNSINIQYIQVDC